MPWIKLENSGLDFAFDSRVSGVGATDLADSRASQSQGSPPTSANAAAWAALFYTANNGGGALQLRVTPESLVYSGASQRPVLSWGLGSPFLGGQSQLGSSAVAVGESVLATIPPDSSTTYLCFAELQTGLEPVNSSMLIEVLMPSMPSVSDVQADLPATVAGTDASIQLSVSEFPEESGSPVDFRAVEFDDLPSGWSIGSARLGVDEQVAVVEFPSSLAPGLYEFQYRGQYGSLDSPEFTQWAFVAVTITGATMSYNCACDDGQPTVTLRQMRDRLARRLGFSVQVSMGALPPGMPELLDDFIRSTHELMYQRYSVMRMRRMFTWDMQPGVRFYDLDGNSDECPRVLNPDKLEWVGISQGDSSWRPLVCGINPVLYGSHGAGIPSHYEIRQCIEVWPAPTDDTWQLRIKGDFGPSALEADDDVLTVDPEAVFLQALANAKAHYSQADAANYASQATAYVRSRVAGAHQTRRYIPGSSVQPPAVRPVLKES